jgi:hypothetical protein
VSERRGYSDLMHREGAPAPVAAEGAPAPVAAGGQVAQLDTARARRTAKTHRWTRWSDELPKHFALKAYTLALASYLAKRADNETGACWAYIETIATAIGFSARSIQRGIQELVRAAVLEVVVKGGPPRRPHRFRLVPFHEGVVTGSHHRSPSVVTGSPSVVTDSHHSGDRQSPQSLTVPRTTPGTDLPRPPMAGQLSFDVEDQP